MTACTIIQVELRPQAALRSANSDLALDRIYFREGSHARSEEIHLILRQAAIRLAGASARTPGSRTPVWGAVATD
jgi:hypothetical protein